MPRVHHYNPQFALRRWVGSDGKLCVMRLVYGGKVVPKRYYPAETGKLYDLYRVEGVPEEISQDLEIKFMTPLDTGAAVALDHLLTGKPLDPEQRLTWARYLLSMLFRNPDSIELFKTHMSEIWREGIDANEARYAAVRESGDPATAAELIALRMPGAAGISAANLIADVIGNSSAVLDIAAMSWAVVDLSQSKFSLLTSDRPLVMSLGLSDPQCLLVVPLSPNKLFVASRDPRFTKPLPAARHAEKVKVINKAVVRQAREFVWGRDDAQVEFVRKHMRTVPDRVILTEEQRRQAIATARGIKVGT